VFISNVLQPVALNPKVGRLRTVWTGCVHWHGYLSTKWASQHDQLNVFLLYLSWF